MPLTRFALIFVPVLSLPWAHGCGRSQPARNEEGLLLEPQQEIEEVIASMDPRWPLLDEETTYLFSWRREYTARLEFDPALGEPFPGVTLPRLRAWLGEHEDVIDGVVALSRDQAAFPIGEMYEASLPELEAGLNFSFPRARILWAFRLLHADAVRAWEAGERERAGARMVAGMRVGHRLAEDARLEVQQLGGIGYVTSVYALEALLTADPEAGFAEPDRSEILERLRRPTGRLEENVRFREARETIERALAEE